MIRHRFNAQVGDTLCEEEGGEGPSGRCSQPMENTSVHFNDRDHPFDGGDMPIAGEGRCFWLLQDGPVGVCGEPRWSILHTLGSGSVAEGDTSSTVILDLGPVVAQTAMTWREGSVRPPDEDAEARMGSGAEETWATSAAVSLGSVLPGPLQEALDSLEAPNGCVLGGPWPVRKYTLHDAGSAVGLDQTVQYAAMLRALARTGADYMVSVSRVRGTQVRSAIVVWDWAIGLDGEVLRDELVAYYG